MKQNEKLHKSNDMDPPENVSKVTSTSQSESNNEKHECPGMQPLYYYVYYKSTNICCEMSKVFEYMYINLSNML